MKAKSDRCLEICVPTELSDDGHGRCLWFMFLALWVGLVHLSKKTRTFSVEVGECANCQGMARKYGVLCFCSIYCVFNVDKNIAKRPLVT